MKNGKKTQKNTPDSILEEKRGKKEEKMASSSRISTETMMMTITF